MSAGGRRAEAGVSANGAAVAAVATVLETAVIPADAIELGRVIGPWGIKGALRVHPHANDPQGLFSCKRWLLAAPDPRQGLVQARIKLPWPLLAKVQNARMHGDAVLATLADVCDRDQAQLLAGARVLVPRSSFPTPQDDEFYWVDLIGCEVVNREGQCLGRVEGLQETGPHCVLRIGTGGAQAPECMIPFVAAYIDRVDLTARRIDVDWQDDY